MLIYHIKGEKVEGDYLGLGKGLMGRGKQR